MREGRKGGRLGWAGVEEASQPTHPTNPPRWRRVRAEMKREAALTRRGRKKNKQKKHTHGGAAADLINFE